MSIDNSIKLAVSNVLKNPVLAVLKEINISKILKESNFIKRDIGYTPFQILLHFIYMLVINKRQSAFIRHSNDAYKKDTYYRFVQDIRYYTAKTTRICPKNQKYGQGWYYLGRQKGRMSVLSPFIVLFLMEPRNIVTILFAELFQNNIHERNGFVLWDAATISARICNKTCVI
jgi:hypothetical protein